MVEIIWGILNLVLLVSFLIISFNAVKLTKEKLGVLSAIILTFGLLSFMSLNKNTKDFEYAEFDLTNSEKVYRTDINSNLLVTKINQNLANTTDLSVKYAKQNNSINLLYAKSNRSGFVLGTKWQPQIISIHPERNNQYNYQVLGQVEWYLLGIKITSQKKNYTGKFILN